MKFAKQLKYTVNECEPDWATHFVAYKKLKKEFVVGKCKAGKTKGVCLEAASAESTESGNREEIGKKRKKSGKDREKDDKKKNTKKAARTDGQAYESDLPSSLSPSSSSCSSSSSSSSCSTSMSNHHEGNRSKSNSNLKRKPKKCNSKRPSMRTNTDTSSPAKVAIGECCAALRTELSKVNTFYLEKVYAFHLLLRSMQAAVKSLVKSCSKHATSRTQMAQVKQQLILLHKQMVQLELYSVANYMGFRKILKKLDKKHGTELKKRSLGVFRLAPFFSVDYLNSLVDSVIDLMADLERVSKFAGINLDEYLQEDYRPPVEIETLQVVPAEQYQQERHQQTNIVYTLRIPPMASSVIRKLIVSMVHDSVSTSRLMQTVYKASHVPMSAMVVQGIATQMNNIKVDSYISYTFSQLAMNHPVNITLARAPRDLSPGDMRVPMSVNLLCVPVGCELQLVARREPGFFVKLLHGTCEFRQYASTGVGDENHVILQSVGTGIEQCQGPWYPWILVKESRHHTIHAISNCMVLYVTCGGLSPRPRFFLEESPCDRTGMVQFAKSQHIQRWEEISL